jgi:tetratricopeptide (TPR) repeat protein
LLYDRAMAAEKIDRLDALEQDLRRLIKLKPDHAHAYNALGYTLADRTERLPEAVELLSQALKLSPDDPFILDSMGWALFKMKHLPEAVEHLRRAFTAKADPEISAHLGEVLWVRNEKGDRDEARQIWQGSLKVHPDNESLREVLSRLKP